MADNLLDDLLNDEEEKYAEEDKILAPLLAEIDLIKNQGVRMFVRTVLVRAPVAYWQGPSSYSGEHHPPDEHGVGGNILHTQRVVRVASHIASAHDLSQHHTDLLLAAALLHDLTKGVEWVPGTVSYDPMHPYTVDSYIDWVQEDDDQFSNANTSSTLFIEEEEIQQILRLIRTHMGAWSPIPETLPLSQLEWALHLADYIASHLHNIIDGKDVQDWRWKKADE